MAASKYETKQYTAAQYVESAGAILFKVTTRQICLVWNKKLQEWLLPKGRRNVRESRADAAVRETTEETGLPCHLLPVTLRSRCTPGGPEPEGEFTPDEPRLFENAREPFMITHRILPNDAGIKLIYWYIGAVNEQEVINDPEDQFSIGLFGFDDAVSKLKYSTDKDIVRNAIEVFERTTHPDGKL